MITNRQRFRYFALICAHLCLSVVPAFAADPKPYLLHLPGIGGHMLIDDRVTTGLRIGGINGEIEIYDWTHGNPGLPALGGYDRNQAESQKIADHLAELYRADPKRPIILTSHSGGGAMATWALEKVPVDVQVQTFLMLAPALSPEYDLSKALRQVKGKAYAFTSTFDTVDGLGTRMMGTMDRQNVDAAGNVGFSMPVAPRDKSQYAKLTGYPYDPTWVDLGNAGDHIGTMTVPFARVILAPLLLTGQMPMRSPGTRPSTQP
jgi:pimeloyl-ACP methyl ester carboxylesterase